MCHSGSPVGTWSPQHPPSDVPFTSIRLLVIQRRCIPIHLNCTGCCREGLGLRHAVLGAFRHEEHCCARKIHFTDHTSLHFPVFRRGRCLSSVGRRNRTLHLHAVPAGNLTRVRASAETYPCDDANMVVGKDGRWAAARRGQSSVAPTGCPPACLVALAAKILITGRGGHVRASKTGKVAKANTPGSRRIIITPRHNCLP